MKKKLTLKKSQIFATMVATSTLSVAAVENVNASELFGATQLSSGYMLAMSDGKCGEGNCGGKKTKEAKCGEGNCGGKKKEKSKEGKCGEGNCGAKKKEKSKEGKCGEGNCGAKKKEKSKEGKCGEGKCGSS